MPKEREFQKVEMSLRIFAGMFDVLLGWFHNRRNRVISATPFSALFPSCSYSYMLFMYKRDQRLLTLEHYREVLWTSLCVVTTNSSATWNSWGPLSTLPYKKALQIYHFHLASPSVQLCNGNMNLNFF